MQMILFGDHQCGFRRNRSTTDQIFNIRQILEKKGSIMAQYISFYRFQEGLRFSQSRSIIQCSH
jgi:hypothetical protein